jgi:hypothetical protein
MAGWYDTFGQYHELPDATARLLAAMQPRSTDTGGGWQPYGPIAPADRAPTIQVNDPTGAIQRQALLSTIQLGKANAVPNSNWQNDGSGVTAYFFSLKYASGRFIFMPLVGGESSGGQFFLNQAKAISYGGIRVQIGTDKHATVYQGNVTGYSPSNGTQGYVFRFSGAYVLGPTGRRTLRVADLRSLTSYKPGVGGGQDLRTAIQLAGFLAGPILAVSGVISSAAPAATAGAGATETGAAGIDLSADIPTYSTAANGASPELTAGSNLYGEASALGTPNLAVEPAPLYEEASALGTPNVPFPEQSFASELSSTFGKVLGTAGTVGKIAGAAASAIAAVEKLAAGAGKKPAAPPLYEVAPGAQAAASSTGALSSAPHGELAVVLVLGIGLVALKLLGATSS